MRNPTMETEIKYVLGVVAATIFVVAAYNLPPEAFFAVFAAGLFLVPASFFVYLVHKI